MQTRNKNSYIKRISLLQLQTASFLVITFLIANFLFTPNSANAQSLGEAPGGRTIQNRLIILKFADTAKPSDIENIINQFNELNKDFPSLYTRMWPENSASVYNPEISLTFLLCFTDENDFIQYTEHHDQTQLALYENKSIISFHYTFDYPTTLPESSWIEDYPTTSIHNK